MKKAYFNWSTGKDSALALFHTLQQNDLSVDLLLTTINSHHNRISMHGLRRALYEEQVKALSIPSLTLELPESPSMETYDQLMKSKVGHLSENGFTDCVFGDIFLEDLRSYREKQLTQVTCHFPLWKRDTTKLITEFVDLGFKAVIIALNSQLLDRSLLGRKLDHSLIKDLPSNVDPCGENGEFHTFCYDGPIFSNSINFIKGEETIQYYKKPNGEIDEKMGFWFLDLLPQD